MVAQPRSSQRYEPKPRSDELNLTKRILELARANPRFGYRRITAMLRLENWNVSAGRVFRLWRHEGLKVPQKKRKRRRLGTSENGCGRQSAEHRHDVWCWDFIFDRTYSGTSLKWFSVVDEFTRESLALKVDRSFKSEDVIDTLAELFAIHGVPKHIRSDNGPEFVAKSIQCWFDQLEIKAFYIKPGSPWQNGYAESFFSRFRDEFLAVEEFESLAAAKCLTKAWQHNYNNHRPHSSLGYQTPAQFAACCANSAQPKVLPPSAQRTSID